jgi:hypothetical protein
MCLRGFILRRVLWHLVKRHWSERHNAYQLKVERRWSQLFVDCHTGYILTVIVLLCISFYTILLNVVILYVVRLIIMLNVIILYVVRLIIMLNVIILYVVRLSIIMLNIIILCFIMLFVKAGCCYVCHFSVFHNAECHNTECHKAQWHNAGYCYADYLSYKCRLGGTSSVIKS